MLDVKWGNRLERLAEAMFDDLQGPSAVVDSPASVFSRRDVIVVPNRLVQHWLLHRFLYRAEDAPMPRILADVDFPLLNMFVNDWLGRMDQPGTDVRDPAAHPFSVPAMRWRIFGLLRAGLPENGTFAPLQAYVHGGAGTAVEARAFQMAGRLATMLDEYMVYRPDRLRDWESGRDGSLEGTALAWQPALWRLLTAGPRRRETYLDAFCRMPRQLAASGIQDTFRAVHVFGVSMMPPVYVYFFDLLGDLLPVRFYTLNPCRRDWFDERRPRDSLLEGRLDNEELFSAGNPFLNDQGRGSRDFLVELLDRTQGQAEAGSLFVEPPATALGLVQRDLLDGDGAGGELAVPADAEPDQKLAFWPLPPEGGTTNTAETGENALVVPALAGIGPGRRPKCELLEPDGTIQVHVCHSPMRELEVLRDYLLRRFADEVPLHPREIQVQVADMATYAPYIDAVFAETGEPGERRIPYVVADRVAGGESRAAEAFRRLLELAGSRFTAPDVLDLLYGEHVRAAFGFEAEDIALLASWVEQAGIRWGNDAQHRRAVLAVDFDPPAATTWQYGLDRLLLGYAAGADGEAAVPAQSAPLPVDVAGSDGAVLLGRLAHFHERLRQLADWMQGTHGAAAWADQLDQVINTFFASTDETYREINVLRQAVALLRKSAGAVTFEGAVGADVVRAFLAAQVKSASGGDDLIRDAVVFSALRPGSSMPRKVMCLVGMGDGLYPRRENRPHYDLLRNERRMGDRSQRIEDRMAFLEAVLGAREHLMISYTGFDTGDGRALPPSVLVDELREYARSVFGGADPVRCVRHRLQAFHPAYFQAEGDLFSYSPGDARASQVYAGGAGRERSTTASPPSPVDTGSVPDGGRTCGESPPGVMVTSAAPLPAVESLELDDLLRFVRNPAAYYYRNILKVELEITPEALPPDSEEFDPASLAGYQVNQALVAGLLSDPPLEPLRLRRRLEADGLLPLAHAGDSWFARRLEAMQALLAVEIDGLGSLGDALRRQAAAESLPVTVPVDGWWIEGACRPFVRPGSATPLALDVRWGTVRGEDRFASWLRHLFACAAGAAETRFFFGARPGKDEKPELACFAPLERGTATALLLPFLALFREGRQHVPLFTPSTAYAYVSAYRREKRDDGRADAGLKKALSAWGGDFGDGTNVYYRQAFGTDGPFDPPDAFTALAERLAGPLHDAAG